MQTLPEYDDIFGSSEARLRDFALASADWFWEMDQDLRFTFVSPSIAKFGASPKDILGKTIEELLGDRYDPENPGAELLALRGRRPYRHIEARSAIVADCWISVSGILVYSEDGRFLGYRGAGTDITARRQAEEVVRKHEERYRHFADASADWFWETDSDLRFTWFSPDVERYTDFPREWYYGKTRQDLGTPDASKQAWEEHLATLAQRKAFRDFTYRRESPDGVKWMRSSGAPVFDDKGEFLGYRGSGSEITDLVNAQKAARLTQDRLAQAVESLDETFILFDPDDRIVFCNQKYRDFAAEVVEYTNPGTKFEDLLRARLRLRLIPEALGREEAWLVDRMERHVNPKGPFEIERQDGQWGLISEERTPDGGFIFTSIDITQRIQMEKDLLAEIANAERLDREKNRLFSIIAHDLRGPLNAQLGLTEFITANVDQMPSEQIAEYLRLMNVSGQSVGGLLENLLEYAQSQLSTNEPEMAAESIAAMAREAITPLLAMAKAKGIELVLKATDTVVAANRPMVLILIRNLVANAIKFTRSGGTVTIESHDTKAGAEVEVRDTGIGMSRQQMDNLFRLDKTTSTAGTEGEPGTGLGLILCHELAERQGSDLHAESMPGKGSSFRFCLNSYFPGRSLNC